MYSICPKSVDLKFDQIYRKNNKIFYNLGLIRNIMKYIIITYLFYVWKLIVFLNPNTLTRLN
jgi:hypothetical protein